MKKNTICVYGTAQKQNLAGGVESLITYPVLQTHADLPKEIRDAKGIDETLLRLSVGIEDVDDLIADLALAFEKNRGSDKQ